MADCWKRWEIKTGDSWDQPAVGYPDPFNSGGYIASYLSAVVYGPGFNSGNGAIYAIGGNQGYSTPFGGLHVWKYLPATNVWAHVGLFMDDASWYGVVAVYGYGHVGDSEWSGEAEPYTPTGPYVLIGCLDSSYRVVKWKIYHEMGTPASPGVPRMCDAPDFAFSDYLFYPMVCWDGQHHWMYSADVGYGDLPHMWQRHQDYVEPAGQWNPVVMSGTPGTDHPLARKGNGLFQYVYNALRDESYLVLAYGTKPDDTWIGDSLEGGSPLWYFNKDIWTTGDHWWQPTLDPLGANDPFKAHCGHASNGSRILMLGGFDSGWVISSMDKEFTPTAGVERGEWSWAKSVVWPYADGSQYGCRCCGRMRSGAGVPLVELE